MKVLTLLPAAQRNRHGRRALRHVAVSLVASLAIGCGGGASQLSAEDEHAEWHARRASERVTGPDGRDAPGFPHRRDTSGDGGHDDSDRDGGAGQLAGGGPSRGPAGSPLSRPDLGATGANANDPADKRYTVVLSPPAIVGERSWDRTEARVVTETVLRVNGNEIGRKQEDRAVRIVGMSTVREVNSEGVATVIEIEVDAATVDEGGKSRALTGRGSVVTVRRNGPKPRIDVNGSAPSPAELGLWEVALTTSDPGASNDAVLGTKEPRGVGESWPIDANLCADDLSRGGKMTVAGGDVSGQTTLVAAKVCGKGQTCLQTRTEIALSSFDIIGLPPQASLREATSAVRLEMLQPLVPRSAPGMGVMDMRMHWVIGMTQQDRDVEIDTTMRTVQSGWSEPR
jgi:hypothetical protein